MFAEDYTDSREYATTLYAGMLFNVSMKWLDEDCREDISKLAELIIDAIY